MFLNSNKKSKKTKKTNSKIKSKQKPKFLTEEHIKEEKHEDPQEQPISFELVEWEFAKLEINPSKTEPTSSSQSSEQKRYEELSEKAKKAYQHLKKEAILRPVYLSGGKERKIHRFSKKFKKEDLRFKIPSLFNSSKALEEAHEKLLFDELRFFLNTLGKVLNEVKTNKEVQGHEKFGALKGYKGLGISEENFFCVSKWRKELNNSDKKNSFLKCCGDVFLHMIIDRKITFLSSWDIESTRGYEFFVKEIFNDRILCKIFFEELIQMINSWKEKEIIQAQKEQVLIQPLKI